MPGNAAKVVHVAIAVHCVTDANHSITGQVLQNKCSEVVLASRLLCVGGKKSSLVVTFCACSVSLPRISGELETSLTTRRQPISPT